jgi:hypothetical protein
MPAADMRTLQQFGAFMEKMSSQLMPGMGKQLDVEDLGGLPVRTQHGGEPAEVLRAISHDALPASLFTAPSGYTREALTPKGR